VVFVCLIAWDWIEGDLVVDPRIGEGPLQQVGDVVAGVESKTATLGGEYLQR